MIGSNTYMIYPCTLLQEGIITLSTKQPSHDVAQYISASGKDQPLPIQAAVRISLRNETPLCERGLYSSVGYVASVIDEIPASRTEDRTSKTMP
jgi:hypothetical protein